MPEIAEIQAGLSPDGRTLVIVPSATAIRTVLPYLKHATPVFKPTKPPGGILMDLSWPGVVQAAATLGNSWRPNAELVAWITAEFYRRQQATAGELSIPLPEGKTPRPYQIEGARMIAAMGRALLFDDPGTGKTITAILGVLERTWQQPNHGTRPILCVVPASVVDHWVNEWREWMPAWTAVAWRGTPKARRALAGMANVYVAGYETARIDAGAMDGPLMKLGAQTVIIDECHMIKTPDSMRSLAVRRLARKAAHMIALSGTPITHHPGDLWPSLEALCPTAFPARERFVKHFCLALPGDYKEQIFGLNPATEDQFRAAIMGQHRRVAKADVLPSLPPKVYSVREVPIPSEWRKAYDGMEKDMLAELPNGDELSVMHLLERFTRLSQLASAPADVSVTWEDDPKTGEPKQHVTVTLRAPSWKVDALLDVLAERPGSPVLAFAPSAQLMRLAGLAASTATKERPAYRVGYIIGDQSAKERTATVAAFQAGELDLLCATTQAGGVGLTLTAAATVVFLQRPWSLVEALQAEDRAHRIGSEIHDSIEIIDIIATDSIDSRVREILRGKADQLSALVKDPRIAAYVLGGAAQ